MMVHWQGHSGAAWRHGGQGRDSGGQGQRAACRAPQRAAAPRHAVAGAGVGMGTGGRPRRGCGAPRGDSGGMVSPPASGCRQGGLERRSAPGGYPSMPRCTSQGSSSPSLAHAHSPRCPQQRFS